MKTGKKLLAGIALCALVSQAHASSYFKDSNNQALIETVQMGGVPVSYGLLVNQSQSKAALYRIESIDATTQAWIRMTQDDSGLIGTNVNEEAAFSATLVGNSLTLTPTDFGKSMGCAAELQLEASRGVSWLALPENASRFSGEDRNPVVLSSNAMTGKFNLDGQVYGGSFVVEPVIAGVGALHAQTLSSDSPDGRALSRTITSLVALIQENGFFGNSNQLKLIRISSGASCFDAEASLNEK